MGNMRGKALTPSGIKCSLQGNSRMDPVLKMENSMITRIKKSLIQTTKSEKWVQPTNLPIFGRGRRSNFGAKGELLLIKSLISLRIKKTS